jgi:hypothetical protein
LVISAYRHAANAAASGRNANINNLALNAALIGVQRTVRRVATVSR